MIVDTLFLGPNNMRSEFAPSRVYQNPSVLHRFRVMGPLVVCLTVMKVKDRPNPIKLDVFRCVPSYQHLMKYKASIKLWQVEHSEAEPASL